MSAMSSVLRSKILKESTFFIKEGGGGYFGIFFAKKVVALPLPGMD